MPWAKLDDRFHENRKVKRVWKKYPAAIGLHVMAITYSAGHLLDGFVDVDFVEEKMPVARMREKACGMLVEVGLWIPEVSGWRINDFAEYNPSRAQVLHKQRIRSAAARNAANARWNDAEGMHGASDAQCEPMRGALVPDAPGPARPVPIEAKASSSEPAASDKAQREIDKATEDDQRLCRLLAELAKERNPKFVVKSRSAWLRSMRLCREQDGHTPEEIERLIRWLFTDSRDAHFWAGVIQSPRNLRDHFAELWGKMHAQPLQVVSQVEDSAAFLARIGAA